MANTRKTVRVDIKFPSKAEVNRDLSTLIEQLNKSTTGIKLDLDIGSFNKSLGEMSKMLSTLKNQLSKFNILEKVTIDSNKVKDTTKAIEEQTKALKNQQNIKGEVLKKSITTDITDGTDKIVKDLIKVKNEEEKIVEIVNKYDKATGNLVNTQRTVTDEVEKKAIKEQKALDSRLKQEKEYSDLWEKLLKDRQIKEQKALDSQIASIEKSKSLMQGKLNTASNNGFVDESVISNLQNKLDSLNTNTATKEIEELKDVINNLSSGDSNIVRLQNTISKLKNNMASMKGKYGDLIGNSDTISQLNKYESELQELYSTMNKVKNGNVIDSKKITSEINNANNSFKSLETSVKNSNNAIRLSQKEVSTFGGAIKDVATKVGLFSLVYTTINSLKQGLINGVDSVISMDSALYDLAKVVDINKKQMIEMRDAAVEMGKELGKSSIEIANAQAEFGRMYKSLDQINKLTKVSTMGSNVMGIDSGEVAKGLTTVMSAMNMEATESMKILDSMNEIQNNYRIQASDLLEALSEVGSVAYTSGAELEKVQGYITSISVSTGDSGSEVGNALRSVMSRIYKLGSEGIEAEGKPEKMLQEMGVAVRDAKGEFRDFPSILDDLNVKWKGMNETQKIATAQTVAGVHRYNSFMALMNNYQVALDSTATALDSQGSALRENEIYMQSAEAKLGTLKATNEEFMYSFVNSDMLKGGITALTGLINTLDNVQDVFGSLGMSVGVLTTAFLAFTKNPLRTFTTGLMDATKIDKEFSKLTSSMLSFTKSSSGAVTGVNLLGIAFDVAKVKAMALQTVISLGLGIAIGVAVKAFTFLIEKTVDWVKSAEKVDEISTKLSETLKGIETTDNLADEYEKLHKKLENTNLTLKEQEDINQRILDIRNELSNDSEFADIVNNENLDLATQLGYIKAINEERKYSDAKSLEKQMTKGGMFSDETKSKTSYNELTQYIEDYKLLMALQKANQGKSFEFNGTNYDLKSQNALIKEYESSIRNAYITIEEWNKNVNLVEDSLGDTDLQLISMNQSVTDFMKAFLNGNSDIEKTTNALEELSSASVALSQEEKNINSFRIALESMGYTSDEVAEKIEELNNKSLDGISNSLEAIATTRYGETIDEMTSLYETIDKINEVGQMTPQIISDLAKQFPEMGSAIFDTTSAIDFLQGKISEWQEIQNQAYAEMMGDNAEYYQTLLANGNQMQSAYDDLIARFTNGNSKGYEIDTNNFNTLNEAKSKMGANVANAMADYLAQMIGGNANGYQTDLNNFSTLAEQKAYILKQLNDKVRTIQDNYNKLINGVRTAGGNTISSGYEDIPGYNWKANKELQNYINQLANLNIAIDDVNTSFDRLGGSFSGVAPSYTGSQYTGSGYGGGSSGSASGGSSGSSGGKTDAEKEAEERIKAEEEANRLIYDMRSKLVNLLKKKYEDLRDAELKAIDDQISALQKQLDKLENGYGSEEERLTQLEEEKAKWENDNSAYGKSQVAKLQAEIEKQKLKVQIEGLEEQKTLTEKKWDEKLANDKIYAEADQLLKTQNFTQIKNLFVEYGELFTETMGDINTYIKNMIDSLSNAQSLVGTTGGQSNTSNTNTGGSTSKPSTPSTNTGGNSTSLGKGSTVKVSDLGAAIYVDSYTGVSSGTWRGAGISSNDKLYIVNDNNGKYALSRTNNISGAIGWIEKAKIAKYAIGGDVGSWSGGEGRIIEAHSGEGVLTAKQNTLFKKLVELLPSLTMLNSNPKYIDTNVHDKFGTDINIVFNNDFTINGTTDKEGKQFVETMESQLKSAMRKYGKKI